MCILKPKQKTDPLLLYMVLKSILLEYIANYAIQNDYNVCFSAPAGKLAARYARRLPECRCKTVHANFYVPSQRGGTTRNKLEFSRCPPSNS